MGPFDLLSQRIAKVNKQGQPDVYQFDNLPQPFRIQVAHIWNSAIGQYPK